MNRRPEVGQTFLSAGEGDFQSPLFLQEARDWKVP
jgi:hypothetical protein